MQLQATIVFQKNWDAIHKICDCCSGTGLVDEISCEWCGDGETEGLPGSGKHYKYIINEGSSRSSKTVSLIDCYDLYARQNDDKRLTVWRDTKTDCKKTVLKDAKKRLKASGRWNKGFKENKTESFFHYHKTDSTFEIHGTDDEEAVHGLEQDAAWLNEPYKISKDTFDQIDMRTTDFVFIDWNPKKAHWVEDLKKDKRAIIIHSTFKDNPFCPPEQKKKILSYQPVSMCYLVEEGCMLESEAMAYDINKNPDNYMRKHLLELLRCRENESKGSADAFKWSVYGLGLKAERPHRIFRWNKISLTEYHEVDVTKYVGSDWGKVDPWGIVEVKYYDGALYVRQLNYASENEIRYNMSATERTQIAGEDEGIVSWMFTKLGISKKIEVICDTNRPNKIAMLRRKGWPAYAANKFKGSVVDGIDLLDNLEIYFTDDSPDLEYEQENYSRKVDRYGKVLEDPEDMDNHLMDSIRYVALHLQRMGIIKVV